MFAQALVRPVVAIAVVLISVLGLPVVLAAQGLNSGSIQGRVADETGGALPGVTVVVSGPALQIPQLTATTTGDGTYRFAELPAGVYRVSYELSGFQTVVREEVRLNVGFAARLDIVLKVGVLEESVTVSGLSPVVDSSTTVGSTNFTKDALERVPISRSMWQVLAMTPGVAVTSTPDVGGSTIGTQQGYKNYGTSGQNKPVIEGVDTRQGTDAAGAYLDYNAFEEIQVRAVGNDAEMALPGTNFVGIVKSGGNQFHGTYMAAGQRPELQSDNIDDELRSLGVTAGNPLKYYWDLSADLGGRLIRDKLWFYTAYANQESVKGKIGYARAPGPDSLFGTSDDELGESKVTLINYTLKKSYQPSPKYRFIGFVQRGEKLEPERGGDRFRPAENTHNFEFRHVVAKGELQGTPSDNVLYNILIGRNRFTSEYRPFEDVPGKPTRFNRETGLYTGIAADVWTPERLQWSSQGSVSFFPEGDYLGRHSLKTGYFVSIQSFGEDRLDRAAGNYRLVYDRVGGVPNRPVEIVTYNLPITGMGNRMTEYSAYVKDTWTIGSRVTLNAGIRLERYHSFVDEQEKAQGAFGSSGTFPKVDVLTWQSVAPRFGLAYDVTGNGRTVVKATYGLFNHTMGDQYAARHNLNNKVETTYRWRDQDGNNDYTPGEVNLDINGPDFLSTAGATSNLANPDLRQPVTHEFTAGIERELVANVSARALYVYKNQQDLFTEVNVLRPYSAFTIPITRRDPGPDGVLNTADDAGRVTFFDYDRAFAGGRFVGRMPLNSDRNDYYHSIEATLNKRHSNNWDLLASVLATKNHRWLTQISESPNDDVFPLDETWNWQFKLVGSYTFPWDVQLSSFFQSMSGDPGQRTYVFRSADPDGGPPIAQSSTVTLRLEPFGARMEPTLHVLNLRVSKQFELGAGKRFEIGADLFNMLNANEASAMRWISGPQFGSITEILPPRIVRIGGKFNF